MTPLVQGYITNASEFWQKVWMFSGVTSISILSPPDDSPCASSSSEFVEMSIESCPGIPHILASLTKEECRFCIILNKKGTNWFKLFAIWPVLILEFVIWRLCVSTVDDCWEKRSPTNVLTMIELDYFRVCSCASDHMLISSSIHLCFMPYFSVFLTIYSLYFHSGSM